MREHLRFSHYVGLTLLLALSAGLTMVLGLNEHFTFTHEQMLLKGLYAAITGQYLPFGNEGGVLGHNPGVLSVWLMGFPFKLHAAAYAPLYFQVALHLIALLIVVRALTRLFAPRAVLLGALFLAVGPWALAGAGFNPAGFLSLGSALVLSSLVYLRRDREFKIGAFRSFISTLLLVLGLGWCLQVHSSGPLLSLMVLLLWLRRDITLSLVGLVLGLIIVGLALVPYGAQVLATPELTQRAGYWGYGLVHVYPLFLGLLDVLRLGSLLGPQDALLPQLTADAGLVGTGLNYLVIGLYWLLGLASLVLTAACYVFTVSRFSGGAASGRLHLVRAIALCALLAVLLWAALLPHVITPDEVVVLLPFALLPLLAYFSVRAAGAKLVFLLSLIFMVLSWPSMAFYSQRFNSTTSFHQQVYRTCLLAFPEQDCFTYGAALPDDVRLNMAGSLSIDEALVERVLQGQGAGGEVPVAVPVAPVVTPPEPPAAAQGELQLEDEVVDSGDGVRGELVLN